MNRELVFLVAMVGLANCLALAQTVKLGFAGSFCSFASLAVVPGAALLLYCLALTASWWTVAVFLVLSLIVGGLHGSAGRRHGLAFLVSLQPIYAIFFLVACAVCAFSFFI